MSSERHSTDAIADPEVTGVSRDIRVGISLGHHPVGDSTDECRDQPIDDATVKGTSIWAMFTSGP